MNDLLKGKYSDRGRSVALKASPVSAVLGKLAAAVLFLFLFLTLFGKNVFAATYYVPYGTTRNFDLGWVENYRDGSSSTSSIGAKIYYTNTGGGTSYKSWTPSYKWVYQGDSSYYVADNHSTTGITNMGGCGSATVHGSVTGDKCTSSKWGRYVCVDAYYTIDLNNITGNVTVWQEQSSSSSYVDSNYASAYVYICNHPGWSGWCTSGNTHYRYCTRCGAWMTSHGISSSGWATSGSTHYTYCTGGCGIWLSSHGISNSGWCTSGNTHYRYCTQCGAWTTSHTIADSGWKPQDASNHYKYCTTCSTAIASASAHTFTYTWNSGSTHTKACSVCGQSTSEGCSVTNGQCTACGHYFTTTITFDPNGGTGGPGTKELQIGDTYTPTPDPSRTGYAFSGWKNGSNTYAKGAGIVIPAAATTYSAVWTPHAYSIVYDGNTASSGTMTADAFEYGTAKALKANAYAKTGYHFTGWNDKADGSGASYADKQSVKDLTAVDGGTVTLYAQWAANTYTVSYKGNGSTSGSVSDSEHAYDVAKNLNANEYKRTGYTYGGWNDKADGSGASYADKQSVKNLTAVSGGTVNLYAKWAANTYTLKFNGNAGSGSTTPVLTDAGEVQLTYDIPTVINANAQRTGYSFEGWNRKADGSGALYAKGASVKNLSSINGDVITLYAKWAANTYKMRYNGNGSTSGSMADSVHAFDAAGQLSMNTYKKTGYLFNGWNDKADGSGTGYTDGQSIKNLTTVKNDIIELFAQWAPVNYKVVYDGNGATSGVMSESSHTYDLEKELNLNVYLKKGYLFTGWNTKADGSGTGYADKAKVKNLTDRNSASVTLYAQWKPVNYTIKFDANKGSGSSAVTLISAGSIASVYDTPVTVNASAERAGYRFTGWNTEANGTGTAVASGGETKNLGQTEGMTVTLYAQWKPYVYSVRYNGNNSTSGSMTQSTHTYDVAKPLTDNAFLRSGYTFTGWNAKSNGTGASYANKQSVKNLTSVSGGTYDIYAQWSANTYTVTFDKQQGSGGSASVGAEYDADMPAAVMPTRTGYIFKGYYSGKNGAGSMYYTANGASAKTYDVAGDITLYAKWEPIKYTVKFSGNGGTGSMQTISMTYDREETIPATGFSRVGYDFMGYNTQSNGSGTAIADQGTIINLTTTNNATVTLYARWGAVSYKVSYDKTSGSGTMADSNHEFDVPQKLSKNSFTKTGYLFTNWNDKADGSGTSYADSESVVNLTSVKNAVVKLYAFWRPVVYKVAYKGNGSTSGSMGATTHTYDELKNLSANSYQKTGYTFNKWFLNAGGTGTSYTDGQSIKNLSAAEGSTVNLYANWTANGYTVRFDANKGSGSSDVTLIDAEDMSAVYDTPKALKAKAARTGYLFKGWNTKADGSGANFLTGDSVNNLTAVKNGVVTLYAQWTPVTYTVRFNGNKGSGSTDTALIGGGDIPAVYDASFAVNASATRTGYGFAGWNTSPNGTGRAIAKGESVKNLTAVNNGVVTLYAQWTPNTYTIREHSNKIPDVTADKVFTFDVPAVLMPNGFFNVGHSFIEWNTKADGSGTSYTDGQEVVNLAADNGSVVDIYAQWGSISYSISFNGNGATSGHMGAAGYQFDRAKKLVPNSYAKTGYLFNGWNTKADGSGTGYADEETVLNLAETEGAVVTLFAQWRPVSYTVGFNGNFTSGSNAPVLSSANNVSAVYDVPQRIDATAVRTGYSFEGWNTKANGSGDNFLTAENFINLSSVQGDHVTLYAQWSPNSYTIRFDANKGSGSTTPTISEGGDIEADFDGSYTLSASGTRTGYKFGGWNTKADGTGTHYAAGDQLSNLTAVKGAVVTLYAEWTPNTYLVRYNANGGTGAMADTLMTFDASGTLSASSFARTGYIFDGWTASSSGSGKQFTDGQSVKNLSSTDGAVVTLYAKWKPVSYKLKFDANDAPYADKAVLGKTEATVYYDASYTLDVTASMKGYKLKEWNTLADGTGDSYHNGDTLKNLANTQGAVVTLYAQWIPVGYYIDFDANKGSGSSVPVVESGARVRLSYGQSYMLTAYAHRDGYDFEGWTVNADGTGRVYGTGDMVKNLSFTEDAVVTLYAKWKPVEYTVRFDKNTGTGSTEPALSNDGDIAAVYDKPFTVRAGGTRDGYIFFRWNTRADGTGTTVYKDASVVNLTKTDGEIVTLYAQWTPIRYDVSYKANGGEGTVDKSSHIFDVKKRLNKNLFAKTGYLFDGWAYDADAAASHADTEEVVNLTLTDGADIPLYAKWRPVTYYIRFNANGGAGTMDPQELKYDTQAALTENAFTRKGHKFAGWNTKPNGSGTGYADKASVENLSSSEGSVITLYAQWETISYRIEYDENGGTGSMTSSALKYDVPLILTKCAYTKEGHSFAGWTLNADGTGAKYSDGAVVKNLAETDGAVVKLYAQWTPNTYSLDFRPNKGAYSTTVTLHNTTGYSGIEYGRKFRLSASASRDGYEFIGWNTAEDGSGAMYFEGYEYQDLSKEPNGVVVLYAQWTEREYRITYHLQGGSWVGSSEHTDSREATQTVAMPEDSEVVRSGYIFVGWYSNPSGLGERLTEISAGTMRDYDVYAVWIDEDGHADGVAPHVTHELG